jgi:hypothetical protein
MSIEDCVRGTGKQLAAQPDQRHYRRKYHMSDASTVDPTRWLKPFGALIASAAVVIFLWRSFAEPLWLDEVLTVTLVQAHSLPKLWAGIIAGIDGNPPLYLTLAWLITHALPSAASIAALKLASVIMTIAAIFTLYRGSLRVASPLASWTGILLFVALNDNLIYVVLELRTYALYFLLAALAVLFQQRLIEHRRTGDAVALGLVYAALTLAHTFGIVYVVCFAIAGWLSQIRSGWHHAKLTVLATSAAIAVFACWIPFLIEQSALGRPYLWFGRPGVSDLLQTVFSSPLSTWVGILELYCLVSAAIWFAHRHGVAGLRSFLQDEKWQPNRYVALVLAGITGFTLAAWIVSRILFPMFVPRYFTPQLIVSLALHVAFCELVVRLAKDRFGGRMAGLAISAIVIPPVLFGAALLCRDPVRWQIPCSDSNGAFFETDFVHGDLPVITESSHVFLPRVYYSSHPEVYRFPLDWDVVLKYPQRSTSNATDFNVLQSLRTWADMGSIMSTEEIIRDTPEFLVIEQSGRAWFHNLRTTRDVSAEKLTEVTSADGSQSCTLWKVTGVKGRS